jgi:hypothetical protein
MYKAATGQIKIRAAISYQLHNRGGSLRAPAGTPFFHFAKMPWL